MTNHLTYPVDLPSRLFEGRGLHSSLSTWLRGFWIDFGVAKSAVGARCPPLKLGDSKIAALVSFKGISYYIITNANYIPALPIRPEHSIFMCNDCRFGDDDYTLWPQQYNETYCHLGAIHQRVTDNNKSLSCMWWDVTHNDFICPKSGRAIIRGLGKLRSSQVACLMQGVARLIEQCGEYEHSLQPPNKPSPLFVFLINQLKLSQDRLQNLPATFDQMKLTVTQFQRTWLELHGLLRYMQFFKPRMENPDQNADVPVQKCIGAFTSDAVVAQQFRRAGLPYWWLRDTWQFTTANIWKVIEPIELYGRLTLLPLHSLDKNSPEIQHPDSEIKTGTSTAQKIAAIRDRWRAITWYCDPFDAEGSSAARATNPLKSVKRPPVPSSSQQCRDPFDSEVMQASAVAGASNTRYDDNPHEPHSMGENIDMMDEDFEEGDLPAAAPSLEPPQFAGPSEYGSGERSQVAGPGSSRNPRRAELEPPQFAGPSRNPRRAEPITTHGGPDRRGGSGEVVRHHPYGQKRGGAPQKGGRDKFDVFQAPEMPPSIEAWAVGLRAIDQSLKPTNKVIMQYVFPEPALIVLPADEAKRQLFLHHMSLLHPALFFRMATIREAADLWVLRRGMNAENRKGKGAERGSIIDEVLGPALRACGQTQALNFPAEPGSFAPISTHRAQEIVWEVAEANFRFELLSLDHQATCRERPYTACQYFAGGGLMDLPLRLSKEGLAAASLGERHPYILQMARMMTDWEPCAPDIVMQAIDRTEWGEAEMIALEMGVAAHYTQRFFTVFGHAPVIPMRLEHDLSEA
ncbi:hypothetical protein B0H17DRAFT_1127132 [Mycena rosella]|uniref:Uncharacterized protein n=1 Tax=Mycena rosella TaxID=1033263 RepID=A0AAD7E2F8_MYCRO|nr:hypothetical protein B0H17DRAFT_1127132 [Mycena rosella]